jgi:tripartite-type tricarboxylate transporter receptor subunit TctC
VALARANPGKLNVAGAPGLPEFSVEAFAKENNLEVTKVPYRDVAQAAIDLSEGRIHFLSMSYAVATPHLEAKKIRQLATGGTKRSPLTPDVPSALESGFAVLGLETTVGLFGPSTMPRALRERIAPDVLEALADPVVAKKLVDSGQAVIPQGPDQLAAALKEQTAAAERAAKILGITPKR